MKRSQIGFYVLQLEDLVSEYRFKFPLPPNCSPPLEIARTLSVSPPFDRETAVIVVREHPAVLAFVGDLQDSNVLLESLNRQLTGSLQRTRYINWEQVESAVETLAQQIYSHLGREAIESASYTSIPRGGSIVIGLLAYALGLEPNQLGNHTNGELLIVVDDCSLSGQRFREFMDHVTAETVVFAPLFAHPELRKAIEDAEDKVWRCLSGGDLTDLTQKLSQPDRSEWMETWGCDNGGYWVGQPEHLVFPWSENDVGILDPTDGKKISGWQIAPPSLCLKHRGLLALENGPGTEIQVVETGIGELRLADSALYALIDHELAVLDLNNNTAWSLNDVGADMWLAILRNASLQDAADEVATSYQIDQDTVARDLLEFADELIELGLIQA